MGGDTNTAAGIISIGEGGVANSGAFVVSSTEVGYTTTNPATIDIDFQGNVMDHTVTARVWINPSNAADGREVEIYTAAGETGNIDNDQNVPLPPVTGPFSITVEWTFTLAAAGGDITLDLDVNI